MDQASPRASGQEETVRESPANLEEPQAAGSSSTKSRKNRPRKLLKLSVIKRICKVPKNKMRKGSTKISAKVVYTNSQFGQEPIPCKESGCTSCSLAPPRPKASNLLAKRPRPKDSNSSLLAKRKRQCTECKAKNRYSKSNTIITQTEADELVMREHHCICTEVDGQLYKLMDSEMDTENTDYKDLSSLLVSLRQLQHDEEPRLSSKLSVDSKKG